MVYLHRRRALGLLAITSSSILIVLYTYLLFFSDPHIQALVLKITVFINVMIVFSALIVVGYLMTRAPSILPLRELDNDLKNCRDLGEEE